MSEYQYYEFLAIDRPLSKQDTAYLRSLSTRAEITSNSFTNEYQWGDFKGDPRELMYRCFDAHVYVANWGTAIFMLRLPLAALDRETANALTIDAVFDFEAKADHWIVGWYLEESEDDDRFGMEDGRGWMSRLAPLRDELLQGDLRSLYIGWLAGISIDFIEDDEAEPLRPAGLSRLTAAQKSLAEFLDIDKDLLTAAGMGDTPDRMAQLTQKEINAWLDGFSRDDVRTILYQLLNDQGRQAERDVKARFSAWQRSLPSTTAPMPLRLVEEIKEQAETVKEVRLHKRKPPRKKPDLKIVR